MRPEIPVANPERNEIIDALRGFALAGVLVVNLRDLSLFRFLNEGARAALPTAGWDYFLGIGIAALVERKAIAIFTLLFGIGFALQMNRAARAGEGLRFYVRRMLILLVIGFAHGALWHGDVLRFYAAMGLLLVPMARLSARALAWIGVVVALFGWALVRPWVDSIGMQPAPAEEMFARTFAALSAPDLERMFQANLSYDLWIQITNWGLPLAIFGRFLIGAALGRSGVMANPAEHSRFWKRLLLVMLPVGGCLTAFVLGHDYAGWGFRESWRTTTITNLVQISRTAATLSMALAYVAAFVLLFQHQAWRRWMILCAPVGRMPLTNYLCQTLAGIGLFYGVGLGIGPRFGLVGVAIFSIVIFTAQMVFSHWWLSRFHFGPVEWVWRNLTYGRRLEMRRGSAA